MKVSCTAAECLLPNPAHEGMQTAAGDGLVWPWSALGLSDYYCSIIMLIALHRVFANRLQLTAHP